MYIDLFLAREPSAGQEKGPLRSQGIMHILGSELRSLQKLEVTHLPAKRVDKNTSSKLFASVCIFWIQFVQNPR